ncbi:MAG: hypothetical protein HC882_08040 [Acidobacteria bacterium]|nr:hypothetical protein [Acidobacteriota bacterium]
MSASGITLAQAEAIRADAGLATGEGPDAPQIRAAVEMYVGQFDAWYGKQWQHILKKYHARITRRVNPFVRRAQHGDCSAGELAAAIVADWDSRNFVTAGGQALEALAIAIGPHCQKAIAEGVDIQRADPANPATFHLYTVKSGRGDAEYRHCQQDEDKPPQGGQARQAESSDHECPPELRDLRGYAEQHGCRRHPASVERQVLGGGCSWPTRARSTCRLVIRTASRRAVSPGTHRGRSGDTGTPATAAGFPEEQGR